MAVPDEGGMGIISFLLVSQQQNKQPATTSIFYCGCMETKQPLEIINTLRHKR